MPLGLITSPILADCLMQRADRRIGRMCEQSGLIYTRYVDDITISGCYPITSGSYPKLVGKILGDYGFRIHPTKGEEGRLSAGKRITKLCIRGRRLDVSSDYLAGLRAQIDDARLLARGGYPAGPYFTPAQIYGRIQFVEWVRPVEALSRGLVEVRKRLMTKSEFEERQGRPLQAAAGAGHYAESFVTSCPPPATAPPAPAKKANA
jgi:hypothetical protein